MPINQSVTATSQAGAVAMWSAPPGGPPGTTPGSCEPASGSTFPLFSSTVTCQVLDAYGDVATGTFQLNVAPTTQFFTRVVWPAYGATFARAPSRCVGGRCPRSHQRRLRAERGPLESLESGDRHGHPHQLRLAGQVEHHPRAQRHYSLQSVATNTGNNTDTSTAITVTVSNHPPVTAVLIPSSGARLGSHRTPRRGRLKRLRHRLVSFEVTGGALTDQVVATATPTYYGWLAQWNTTTVPNGTYSLQSVATDSIGETTSSSPITVAVNNPPPTTTVLIPSNGATQSGTARPSWTPVLRPT